MSSTLKTSVLFMAAAQQDGGDALVERAMRGDLLSMPEAMVPPLSVGGSFTDE